MDTTYASMIEQIVATIFSSMLNDDLFRVEEPPPADAESLLATVQIAGQWTGSVVLSLSPEIATRSAVAMLNIAPEEVTADDRQDVAAELANMVGGNLKSVLPGPSFLSLPTIVAGREFGLQVHDAQLIEDLVLRSESGSLRVRLYEKIAK